jgi:hypothetical protein
MPLQGFDKPDRKAAPDGAAAKKVRLMRPDSKTCLHRHKESYNIRGNTPAG